MPSQQKGDVARFPANNLPMLDEAGNLIAHVAVPFIDIYLSRVDGAGKPVYCQGLLDTGSSAVILSPSVLGKIGIDVAQLGSRPVFFEGAAGKMLRVRPVRLMLSLEMDETVFQRELTAYVQIEPQSHDREIIIGLEPFFRWFNVDFKLAEGYFTLHERSRPGAEQNPAVNTAAVEKAKREVETFTAYPAKHLRMLSMAPFRSPRKKLCPFETVIYNSPKWTGRMRRFFHPWEDGLKRTVWLTKSGHLIGAGPARNTSRGIDDFKLIHRLMKRAKTLDEVIRNAKGWAKLADLEAVSQPCKKCGATLKYHGDSKDQRWECPRCHGNEPKYRLGDGKVYYDGDSRWLVCVAKVS